MGAPPARQRETGVEWAAIGWVGPPVSIRPLGNVHGYCTGILVQSSGAVGGRADEANVPHLESVEVVEEREAT